MMECFTRPQDQTRMIDWYLIPFELKFCAMNMFGQRQLYPRPIALNEYKKLEPRGLMIYSDTHFFITSQD